MTFTTKLRHLLPGLLLATLTAAAATPPPLLTFDPARAVNRTIADSAGHGVTLTLGEGVAIVDAGGPGGAAILGFNGSDKAESTFKFEERFNHDLLSGDEVSVSLWFRSSQAQEGTIGLGFVQRRHGYMEQAPLGFGLATKTTPFGSYRIGSGFDRPMHLDYWHHLAYTYSITNLRITVWYDGRVQADNAIKQDEPAPLENLLQPLGKGFAGAIADIKIWNRALPPEQLLTFRPTAAEITALESQFASAADATSHAPFKAWCQRLRSRVSAAAAGLPLRDWQRLQERARKATTLANWTDSLGGNSTLAEAPLACFTFYPFSDQKRLPHILPHDGSGTDTLQAALAGNEYEALTFMLHPFKDIERFEIKATPLSGPGGALPPESLTIRLVKCWHTTASGWNHYFGGGREFPTLAPELLLYDDSLIVTDEAKRQNLLRVDYPEGARYLDISIRGLQLDNPPFNYMIEPVSDATTLQPLALQEGRNQQFWITLHAPADAKAGLYTSRLDLIADGQKVGSIQLDATVHPFNLPRPRTNYDLSREYYGVFMHHIKLADQIKLGKDRALAERRLLAELKNMVAHNMLHPHSPGFDNPEEDELTIRFYEIMREAGMPCKPLWAGFACDPGWMISRMQYPTTSPETKPEEFARVMTNFRKRIDRQLPLWDKHLGHRDVFFSGWDEAGPGGVRHQYPFFSYLHKHGFKVFTTSGNAFWNAAVSDCNDIPARITRTISEQWHAGGGINMSYAAPFTGPENPELWRRSKGIRMYLANYDGLNEYIWYEGYHIWNEFLTPATYKNFNIVYPTIDGVIDTIPWESLREAFDDIRYATKLRQLATPLLSADDTARRATARRALLWLGTIDPEVIDLDEMRATMVDWILKLN